MKKIFTSNNLAKLSIFYTKPPPPNRNYYLLIGVLLLAYTYDKKVSKYNFLHNLERCVF